MTTNDKRKAVEAAEQHRKLVREDTTDERIEFERRQRTKFASKRPTPRLRCPWTRRFRIC